MLILLLYSNQMWKIGHLFWVIFLSIQLRQNHKAFIKSFIMPSPFDIFTYMIIFFGRSQRKRVEFFSAFTHFLIITKLQTWLLWVLGPNEEACTPVHLYGNSVWSESLCYWLNSLWSPIRSEDRHHLGFMTRFLSVTTPATGSIIGKSSHDSGVTKV